MTIRHKWKVFFEVVFFFTVLYQNRRYLFDFFFRTVFQAQHLRDGLKFNIQKIQNRNKKIDKYLRCLLSCKVKNWVLTRLEKNCCKIEGFSKYICFLCYTLKTQFVGNEMRDGFLLFWCMHISLKCCYWLLHIKYIVDTFNRHNM